VRLVRPQSNWESQSALLVGQALFTPRRAVAARPSAYPHLRDLGSGDCGEAATTDLHALGNTRNSAIVEYVGKVYRSFAGAHGHEGDVWVARTKVALVVRAVWDEGGIAQPVLSAN
jgi:hypothetical protein